MSAARRAVRENKTGGSMSKRWGTIIAGLFLTIAPSVVLAQIGKPPPELRIGAAGNLRCTALGWKADHIENNHVTSWSHGLGSANVAMITVYFSPGGDDAVVYPVVWSHEKLSSGNPVTIELTREHVNLHIWSGSPLHGAWNARAADGRGHWTTYATGYWNVVLCQ